MEFGILYFIRLTRPWIEVTVFSITYPAPRCVVYFLSKYWSALLSNLSLILFNFCAKILTKLIAEPTPLRNYEGSFPYTCVWLQ